jgi:hypothetical protein
MLGIGIQDEVIGHFACGHIHNFDAAMIVGGHVDRFAVHREFETGGQSGSERDSLNNRAFVFIKNQQRAGVSAHEENAGVSDISQQRYCEARNKPKGLRFDRRDPFHMTRLSHYLWKNKIELAPVFGGSGALTGPIRIIIQMIWNLRGPEAGNVTVVNVAFDGLAEAGGATG